ncbi:Ig-like domain-containing protein, partial [Desulfosarcina sp. OttesenSCG-928-A07]|nr:Ig-like domain-containing protein [Desulfosarcina sp. OttesenSCG-928-A07]
MFTQGIGTVSTGESNVMAMVYQLNRSQVTEMSRVGNDLVIHLINGTTTHLEGFFAGGMERVLLLKESDGSIWQANFTQDGEFTAMTGYSPYEGDASWADELPPAEDPLASPPKGLWDGYAIEIQSYTDDVGEEQGDFPPHTTTDDSTPRLNGVVKGLKPGDQVRIYGDGEFLGYAQVDGQGNWYFDVPGADNGYHAYMARIVNAEGIESNFAANFVLYVDVPFSTIVPWVVGGLGALGVILALTYDSGGGNRRIPPQQKVTINTVDDDVAPDIHIIQSGGVTNDTTPTLNGTLSAGLGNDEVVAVYRLNESTGINERVGTAGVDPTSLAWTFTDSGLPQDGQYTYTAKVESTATGLSSNVSNTYTIELDTTNPTSSVTITNIIDDAGDEAVSVASGGYTTDITPTLEGTLQNGPLNTGEYVEVLRNGEVIGTATIDANGVDWTFTDSSLGEEGAGQYLYTARVVDAAGNQGENSPSYELTLLTDSPSQTITIDAIMDDYGMVTGVIANGGDTDDATPTLTGTIKGGTLAAYEELVIYRSMDGGAYAEIGRIQPAQTTWSYTDSDLTPDATYVYYVQVENKAGLMSIPSETYSLRYLQTISETVEITQVLDDVSPIMGLIMHNGWTDDGQLQIKGTINQGSSGLGTNQVVRVYRTEDDGTAVLVGTASVSETNWEIIDLLGGMQNQHKYTYHAVVTNASTGDEGEASNSWSVNYDGLAPTNTVTITGIFDDVGTVTGFFTGSPLMTDDNTPELRGTCDPNINTAMGEKIVIYRQNTFTGATSPVGTATVDDLGNWTFTDSGLQDGSTYIYTAKVVKLTGVSSEASNEFQVALDNTPIPGNVDILQIYNDNGPTADDWVLINDNDWTNDTDPVLQGSISSALTGTAQVFIYRDGRAVGTAIMDTATTWHWSDTDLQDGQYTYTARILTGANMGNASNAYTINVDTAIPVVGVAITQIVDDTSGQDVGVAHNGYTQDTTPTLSGTLSVADLDGIGPGEYLEILRNGASVGTITLDTATWDNGVSNWTFTDDLTGETDGQYIYTARVVDPAGNQGAISTAYTMNLLTESSMPTVTLLQIMDNVGEVMGPIENGATTDDSTPTLYGTINQQLESYEELVVYRQTNNGAPEEVARLSPASTSWQYTDSGLSDGNNYTYYAQVENAAGSTGSPSKTHTIRFETDVKVTAAITNVIDDAGPVTGTVAKNTWTDDGELDLEGTISTTLSANEAVYVYRLDVTDDTPLIVGTATVTGTAWTITDQLGGMVDTHTYTYTAVVVNTDTQVSGAVSTGWTVKYDGAEATHTVTIDGIEDNVGTLTGFFPDSPLRSDDDTPELRGTVKGLNTAIGEEVWIFRTDVSTGMEVKAGVASVDNQGSWTFTDGSLNNLETYTYVARVVKKTGQQSPDSNTFEMTLDKTNAGATEILQIYNDDGVSLGLIGKDGWTNDTSPLLKGSIGSPLMTMDRVIIYRNGDAVGTATMKGPTTWEWSDTDLQEGMRYEYQAQVEGTSLGGMSSAYAINLDTSRPTQEVTITSVIDNELPNPGGVTEYTVASGGATNDLSPTLMGTLDIALAANGTEAVQIYRNDTWLGTATMTSETEWIFTDSLVGQPNMAYTYTARVEDKAGNQGDFSNSYTIVLDATSPYQTVIITEIVDNMAPVTGTVADGDPANDYTPTLNGTLDDILAAGEKVVVFRADKSGTFVEIGTAAVTGTDWTFTDNLEDSTKPGRGLDDTYTYKAVVRDAAYNTSAESNAYSMILDTQPPLVGIMITHVEDNVPPGTDNVANNGYTNDLSPEIVGTLTGTLEAGEYLVVLRDGVIMGTATVDTASGTWRFTDDGSHSAGPVVDGSQYLYTARAVDAAGNQSG